MSHTTTPADGTAAGQLSALNTIFPDYQADLDALAKGIADAVNVADTDLGTVMERVGMREGFDIGLEMSGAAPAFRQMIDKMNNGGKIAILGIAPAGFEIDNPNLLTRGEIGDLDWLGDTAATEMAEFRQDRFAAALTIQGDQPIRLAYRLRAVTPGRFHHPAASVEDMYRAERRAWTDSGTTVVAP